MTLKRLALITTALMSASFGFGCSTQTSTNTASDMVRLGAMDTNRNPFAMGSGDALGAALYRQHDLN
ncbi:MAG: hypothetical protein CMJ40_04730 [Phycisphaerae bacterium]|nr:hypothetical protein [Phycisphaerae bacterium]